MIQYGIRAPDGKWLPRDAYKRGMLRVRLDAPDLWQDQERALKYASEYSGTVVAFVVEEVVLRGAAEPEVTCGAV